MKVKIRIVVLVIVAVFAAIVLFPILRERYILHQIWDNPLFGEFKRCKLIDYSFDILETDQFTFINQYTRTYENAMFSFIDTVSKHNITYHYNIYVYLEGFNVDHILLENITEITYDNSMADIIAKMESDSALAVLTRSTDVETCRYGYPNFIFTGDEDIIKYHIQFGIAYFKLRNPTTQLGSIHYYSMFLETVGTKGFASADFDSLAFSRYAVESGEGVFEIWRMQGFSHLYGDDFCEVSREADSPVNFQWHTRRDTIAPYFVEPLIDSKLRATGLPESYRRSNLVLRETGALRYADYYKSGDMIIDASRLVGYYRYSWRTDTWIDKVGDGLQLKVFFTYYMDKRKLEMVRIGLSADNFFDGIALHPLKGIIDFNAIKRINPEISAADLDFNIKQHGDVFASFVHDWYRYEVNIETGITNKEKYRPGGMMCIVPEDRHLYSSLERHFHGIRQ